MAVSTDPASTEAVAIARKGRYLRSSAGTTLFQPTPRQWRLLRWIVAYRLLSMPQLALLAGRTPHTVRQQLRGLFDAGLIDVIPVNRAALAGPEEPDDATLLYGSAPNVYIPTKRGLNLLLDRDLIEEGERNRPSYTFGPRSSTALAHTLLVRDARIYLERCSAFHGGGHQLVQWRDGSDAEMSLSESKRLVPDAWFVYHLTGGESPCYLVGLVEADRGTERGMARWGEKLTGYQQLFRGDLLQRNTGYSGARVLVVTLGEARRERLARLIMEFDREKGLAESLAQKFWLVEKAALESCDIAGSVWRQAGVEGLQPQVGRELAPLRVL